MPAAADVLAVVQESLNDDKAQGVVVIDLSGKTEIADYMVIASGSSQRHVGAMADHLREKLKLTGVKGIALEGQAQSDWVLIDTGDIIVHLFRPEVREFYNLVKMWGGPVPAPGDASASQLRAEA